jgi:putative selenate reductase
VEQCAVCQDVPEYAWLIAQGEYDRALDVILHRNPLPGVTGYVCTHLCQTRCTRNNYDQAVAIRDLKKFATEHGDSQISRFRPPVSKRVAIVGSGPAGLAAAYFLGINGVQATIFEEREMPGGMLAIAPHFRLPAAVVQADVDRITGLGAEIKLNHRVTVPPDDLLDDGFDAVYVATGFQKDAGLNIEGIGGEGVFTAIRFLESVARGERPVLGDKLLVIGGGNTAMDAARTAQRLTGQPSTIVYRRTQAEMPAEEEELRDFFDEGNELIELASPERVVLEEGRVAALECVRNELGEPGPDGRRKPVRVEGSEFRIPATAVVLAIGQKPDITFLNGSGLRFSANGSIVTDPVTRSALSSQVTHQERVYAGGDVTRGPAIIIQACEDGRRAAEAMCNRFGLSFERPASDKPSLSAADILEIKRARASKVGVHEPDLLPVSERAGFDLVELTLKETAARAEAARCLQCSIVCDKCVEVCPNRANYAYSMEPVRWMLPVLACRDSGLAVAGEEAFEIAQERQIVHVDDFCNECGNCATFCVHQGKPYSDKPRLFLERSGFDAEADNAFYIEGSTIWRREGGGESRLALENGSLKFENAQMRVQLTPDLNVTHMELKEPFEGSVSLSEAAEAYVILQGVTTSAPFLLM